MLEVASKEGSDIWSCLANDEVIDVEELGDAGERRISLVGGVRGGFPIVERDLVLWGRQSEPGNYGAGFVFAKKGVGAIVGCRGDVGGEGRGPDEL